MTQDHAYYRRSTIKERFWRWTGFRFHLGDEPAWMADGPPKLGWMQTVSKLEFSLADRLRLLVSGHLRITTTIETDTPSPVMTATRLDWQIRAPGEE